MKVLNAACPECQRYFIRITQVGDFYFLLQCEYCKTKYRVMKEDIHEKGIEILDHE